MKTKKKPTIKTTKPRQPEPRKRQIDKGMRAALDLTGEISLRDVWSSATERIADRHLRAIPVAVDPVRYLEDEKEFKRANAALEKILTTAGQREAFMQFDNARCMREYWIEMAGCYFGAAFVQTIGGGLNLPVGRRRP